MATGWERRDFLKSLTLGTAGLSMPRIISGAQRLPQAGSKPNIIFILADDMGYGDPSCQSVDDKIHTPHMDRLAAEGMRFTDAHSGSAVCTPSRYAILTGRYCWRSRLKRGVLRGYDAPLIEPHRETVPSMLKKHGYATAGFGKWHLGLGWKTKDGQVTPWKDGEHLQDVDFRQPIVDGPLSKGFDYYYGIAASLDMPPYCYIENDRPVQIPTEHTPGGDPHTTGFWRPGPISPDFKHVEVLPNLTHRVAKYIDDHAGRSKETPFFVYFALTGPHQPIAPTDAFKGSSKAGAYGDFVVEVDWAIGEVMKALDRNGISDGTLIIVTSDNGCPARTHIDNNPYAMMRIYHHYPNGKLRGIKADIWEGGHREPFIARWPGQIPAGTTSDETICLADLMATCATIVGEDLLSNAAEDSYNILPAMLARPSGHPIREVTIHHSSRGMYALRHGPWKLIFGLGGGGWDKDKYQAKPDDPDGQLYNVESDIEEKVNLYDRHPDRVRTLWNALEEIKFQGHSRPLSRT